MAKKITIIGSGYVGLVAAVGLADFGNRVIGVDIDENKVKNLNTGHPSIYEPGLTEYLQRNLKSKHLSFTTDITGAIKTSDVIFIAVGTPPRKNGDPDLSQIYSAIESIGKNLNNYKVIVTKSTVPIKTNCWIKENLSQQSGSKNFDVISNPEFLREGKAIHDFFHPDRIVIGYDSEKAREIMEEIYRPLNLIQTPFIWSNFETAELIKYASNAFLATKITFINQISNLSEKIGADIHTIARAMGMDGRISPKFLHPGPGYGGSCFPKDTRAIVRMANEYNIELSLIKETIRANEKQKEMIIDRLKKLVPKLKNKTITLLGLAYKAETDDIRESPAIPLVEKLIEKGVRIQAHDPKAISNFRNLFDTKEIQYFEHKTDAVKNSHIIIICTEWNEYRNLDFEKYKTLMNAPVILDLRNVLDSQKALEAGFTYKGMGR